MIRVILSAKKGFKTYGFGDLDEHKVGERLKVLRLKIILLLHISNLKVDETSVCENNESLLP